MPLLVSAGLRENGCKCPHCGQAVRQGEPSAVCRTCGTVHHGGCWEQQPRCGSYSCAPAHIEIPAVRNGAWKISAEEISRAVPLPARPATSAHPVGPSSPPPPSRNRLALAAFITALAGIPFFGVVTGVVAILLGCLALSRVQAAKQRGAVLSTAAIILGLADVVGWIILLTRMFSPEGLPVNLAELQADPAALEGMPPHLNRAMRAAVLLEVGRGTVGSGCVLNQDGRGILLVTNRHVVDPDFSDGTVKQPALDQLPAIQVHFVLGTKVAGKVVWLAPHGIDLALVRVEGEVEEARTAQWEANRPVRIGDQVFAIGSPLRLGWTVTQGVVSQLRRQHAHEKVVRIIQTQTALNPGNSGGGLFDHDGFLVGVNTWTNDRRISEGLGFAISLDALLELRPPGLRAPVPEGEKP